MNGLDSETKRRQQRPSAKTTAVCPHVWQEGRGRPDLTCCVCVCARAHKTLAASSSTYNDERASMSPSAESPRRLAPLQQEQPRPSWRKRCWSQSNFSSSDPEDVILRPSKRYREEPGPRGRRPGFRCRPCHEADACHAARSPAPSSNCPFNKHSLCTSLAKPETQQ